MAISQGFKPPLAPSDVDALQLDFAPALLTGETLSSPAVSASGGFTFGTPAIGIINTNGTFSANASGTVVQVLATAGSTAGTYEVTFTVSTSNGRTLHRTERCDIATRS